MHFSDSVMFDVDSWCPQLCSGATLITVNQRLARHYQRRFDVWKVAQGASVWDTPDVVSWSAWLSRLHDGALSEGLIKHTVLNAAVDERLWRTAVSSVTDQSSSQGRPELLDKPAAAKQARAAWLIQHAWHCHVAEDTPLSLDQKVYGSWSNAFRKLCHQHKAIDQSRLANHLRELWSPMMEAKLLPSAILHAGFLTPTTEQQLWWKGLAEQGIPVEELGHEYQSSSDEQKAPTVPQRYEFIDDAAEWRAAACHARAQLERNPSSLMGVVIPELQAHRTDVLRAFDAVFFPGKNPAEIHRLGRPYDVSLGVSLAEQSVIRSALQMLWFLVETIPAADVTSVFLSPYFIHAQAAAEKRRKFDRELRNDRRWELTASAVVGSERYLSMLDSSFQKVLPKAVSHLSVKPQTFSAWSVRFGHVLQRQLKWPGDSLESLEYQAVQVWQQVVEELESLDDGQVVPVKIALAELQNLCAQRLFQPETPRAPVQIMGRLESHGLTFDHLWLSGSDASQWPPKATATTLLPRKLQQERGVPESSASHRLNAANLEWAHWLNAAPSIVASRALTRDGQPLLPAACVVELPVKAASDLLGNDQYPNLVALIADSAELKSVSDTHGPAMLEGFRVKGGARRLEDQAKCPFRGFAIHHLGIRDLEEPGMGLDPRGHGNLLHLSLEKFWLEVKTSAALHAMDEEQCSEAVLSAIDYALTEQHVEPQLAELERPRLKRLIDDWLNVEKSRVIGFTIDALEQENLVDVFGIEIRVLIDRIDLLETGERIILDYKTGSSNRPADWALDRIGNPQLPLYATIDENVEGVSFAQVVQNDMGFKGLTRESGVLPRVSGKVRVEQSPETWEEWREHWKASLELLATEIREGVATITPDANACTYCDLKPLCRYRANAPEFVEEGGA